MSTNVPSVRKMSVFPALRGSFWENWDSLWDDLDSIWADSWFNVPARRAFSSIDSKEDKYELKFELPGVEANEIEIQRQGNILTVKAEQERKETGSYFSFVKTITLPKDVDAEKIEADLKSGILKLTIPRVKELEAKQEPIKIGVKSGDEPAKIEAKA